MAYVSRKQMQLPPSKGSLVIMVGTLVACLERGPWDPWDPAWRDRGQRIERRDAAVFASDKRLFQKLPTLVSYLQNSKMLWYSVRGGGRKKRSNVCVTPVIRRRLKDGPVKRTLKRPARQ